jgi:hypothetical protein
MRSGPTTRRVPEWPEEPPSQAHSPAAVRGPPATAGSSSWCRTRTCSPLPVIPASRAALLTGLLTHAYIKLLCCRDKGPAAGLARDEQTPQAGPARWPRAARSSAAWSAHITPGDRRTRASPGQWLLMPAAIPVAYGDRSPKAAADQRKRDALAGLVSGWCVERWPGPMRRDAGVRSGRAQ